MHIKKLENIIVICLVIVTLIIYFSHHYSMDKTFIIDAQSTFPIQGISDNTLHNGKSTSSVSTVDNKIVLDCEIIASDYGWPFCEISIKLYDENILDQHYGIDLSSYDTVSIHASYHNIAPLGIRFQMRNYHSDYSKLAIPESWKYTGLEYFTLEKSTVTIPLSALQVATWWLLERKIPIEKSSPELNNVMVLEISTGSDIKPGKYKIILDKIVFQGKRYNTEKIYGTIIILWVSSTLFLFFYHLALSRHELSKAHKKSQDLKRLNKLLNVRTQELKDQAERDPLTGALNRAGVTAIFTEELPLMSIAFIDIDHFKKVNDTHGHAIGDDILCKFSTLLSENSRDTDFLVRWGGEEFLLICPNTTMKQIGILSEAIRQLIEEYKWPNDIQLTASFGIAQRKKENPTDFIARADKALYTAKAQGRNKVIKAK